MYVEWNTPVVSACQDFKHVYLTRRMVGLQIVDTAIARKSDSQHDESSLEPLGPSVWLEVQCHSLRPLRDMACNTNN